MCGIGGLVRFDGKPVLAADLHTILDKLAHRGRDHAAIALGSKHESANCQITKAIEIGLGHRRLSIIDLSDSASQPMFYAAGNLCLTYNGEIYNYAELRDFLSKKSYPFTTHSDTEVLLAAYHHWGKACVNYLNGMFAFALWDEFNKQLFCARDQLGIKPFYYKLTPTYFAFASESFALTHLENKELNVDAVLAYLMSMYVPSNESIFKGIRKLPPGHTMIVEVNGKVAIERFWSINQFEKNNATEQTLEQLDFVINKAIERQLISDVPVGGFLSGGIDSGLITALAAPRVQKYHTYSVGYEGLADNELHPAKVIAERYATEHTEITISSTDAMVYLRKALNKLSEPIADPAIVATYMLAEIAAADGVKVLLNGTGGDEIFGGYTRYTGQLSFKRRLMLSMPEGLKKLLGFLPFGSKLKARLIYPALDMMFSTGGSFGLASKFFSNKNNLMAFLDNLSTKLHNLSYRDLPLLYQHMLFDLHNYLPDELLLLLDQMTMAHTIEGRVPLLDIDIINTSFNFFAHEHVERGQTKTLLKQIAKKYLGAEYIQRKKQGFAGSTRWWVQKHYAEFLEVIAQIKQIDYFENFDMSPFCKLETINEQQANDMFILYCFGIWHEKMKTG